jgi:membrane protease subunit HflK
VDDRTETTTEIRHSARRTARFAAWIAAALVVLELASGLYVIEPSQVGVVLRFGRVVDQSVPPGIHYALPWPIDRVRRVPVRTVMRLEVDDFRETSELAMTFGALTGLSAYLLTGDNNIVTLSCVLQYSVRDPAAYLFSLADSRPALRSLACSTLLHAVAARPVDEILTTAKASIQLEVKRELQARLDALSSGLDITFVELKEVRPPGRVQQNFDDVINARIDREKLVHNALSDQNERIPRAKGEADRRIRDAEAYSRRIVARAEGDAGRFLSRLVEHRKDPALNRRRLYLELMDELAPAIDRIVVVGRRDGRPVARIVTAPPG